MILAGRERAESHPSSEDTSVLTTTGTQMLVLALVLGLLFVLTRYAELAVVGVTLLVILLASAVAPRLSSGIHIDRKLQRQFVQRGGTIQVTLTATAGPRRVNPMRIVDVVDDTPYAIDIPRLGPRASVTTELRAPANRRGAITIGPAREERSDALGLVVRPLTHEGSDVVWVHPVIHKLSRNQLGGLTSASARPSFAIAEDPNDDFRGIREYVPGDDTRRIHWPTSARASKVMIREQMQIRRPSRLICLDTLADAASSAEFEEMVEIATSLALHGFEDEHSITIRTRSPDAPGSALPMHRRPEVLGLMTAVQRTSASVTLPAQHLFRRADRHDSVWMITGPSSPLVDELLALPRLRSRTTLVRVNSRPTRLRRPPVRTIDVSSGLEFSFRFGGW